MGQHLERGHALFDLKRYREAVDAFRAELAENPDNAVAHAVLGAALINAGNVRAAEKVIRRALELAPDMAYAHYILSFVHQIHRRLWEAEQAIVEAIRLEQDPQHFHQWAIIAELLEKFDDALAATAQALRLDPWHNPSILLRGRLLARKGKLEEAHALYMTALRQNPEDAAAQHAFGSIQLQTGQAATALGALREARRLDPISTNDSASIALAYGRLIWPLNLIDRIVFRWQWISTKKRWLFFTLLAVILMLGSRLTAVGLEPYKPSPLWIAICILVANFFVLPFSFDTLAITVGHFALRREFREPWDELILRPLVLGPAIAAHAAAVFVGFLISFPILAIAACLGMAMFPEIRRFLG